MMIGSSGPFYNTPWDRFFYFFPCLSDPARRNSLCLKLALVTVHLIYVGILFLFGDLIEKTTREPWYTALYMLLVVATLAQYFLTAGSSPGYVLDAMRAANETDALFRRTSLNSEQPTSSKNGSLVVTLSENQLGKNLLGSNATSWTKLVMEMYPPGFSIRTLTCTYCNVMQFDHHCVWLGTCVGQRNHCRFWWFICEETALCIWTGIMYIAYLKAYISKSWWINVIMISLLATLLVSLIFLLLLLLFHSFLVLTNQTTYELVRRRRIPYLRGIPESVSPFSKGACRNLYDFCCAQRSIYSMEPLPTAQELEEKSKPYTCLDALSCRCCC
ncbi:protein S-acyltransferase 10-like isoform X2 [Cornus florida]|uniref:protein S-acyltransferase 10-like isoform X2 n=1 Tax=Cornus florida TaxID=4283 RepID=UPI00289A405C|nr:protein S-acyltransferase 10-like isoform X2 [Cornus florida]